MISKGTTHNNGVKLASYITTGKKGERAELWEMRGFNASNITDAFRDVHIMADATRCEKPFFHVQVRNREGEHLTREQWEYAADRIERILGLTGQPRAIASHISDRTGDEHIHVVWSRIDQDEMNAKALPFFHRRLKTISRELELHFALEPVTNNRKDQIKFAPTRAEEEQARRLGLDIHEIRKTIRDCFERSDSGKAFEAALYQEGLILAKGDKRDFIVIDPEGGMHALGKRVLDVSATGVRQRLADLGDNTLPTVNDARATQIEKGLGAQEQPEPILDQHAAEMDWEDQLAQAAIAKEKKERNFVEPTPTPEPVVKVKKERNAEIDWEDELARNAIKKERKAMKFVEPGSMKPTREQERFAPLHPPVPKPIFTSPEFHFEDAAKDLVRDRRPRPPAKKLRPMTVKIHEIIDTLWERPLQQQWKEGWKLASVLEFRGYAFAKVTKEEADRSHINSSFAWAVGNTAPRYKEGEIVVLKKSALEYRRRDGSLGEPDRISIHRLDQDHAQKFLKIIGPNVKLEGIAATRAALADRPLGQLRDWKKFVSRMPRGIAGVRLIFVMPGRSSRRKPLGPTSKVWEVS